MRLVPTLPLSDVDVEDVDGPLYMVDRHLGGMFALAFTEPADPSSPGTVTIDDAPVQHLVTQIDTGEFSVQVLGVKVFGQRLTPGTTHILHVEGFRATDGAVMAPQDVEFTTRPKDEPRPEFAQHESVARRAAEDGIVLLRNQQSTLPLSAGVLNVFGHGLHAFRTTVVGAGKINPRYVIGLRQAIHQHPTFTLNTELDDLYRHGRDVLPDADVLARAQAASDIGIVVLTRASGENFDNGSGPGEYRLSDDEQKLIACVTRSFARSVVILNTPYPIDVGFAEVYDVDAVVLAGVGGMLAGPALLSILDGTVNPSGRLPDTWPRSYDDLPSSRNFYDASKESRRYSGDADVWIDTVYEEDLYVGYRYFTSFGVTAAYPFGHGLSYTKFQLSKNQASAASGPDGLTNLTVKTRVRNVGGAAGREVVQVYLSKPDGELEQVALELVEFAKTGVLDPGKSAQLTLHIPPDRLASWEPETASFVTVAGEYVVHVGQSSADTVEAGRFIVDQARVLRRSQPLMAPQQTIEVLSRRRTDSYPRGQQSGVKAEAEGLAPMRATSVPAVGALSAGDSEVTFADVQHDPSAAAHFVSGLGIDQLARLTVCAQDGWGMEGTGVAGIVAQPEGLGIPTFQVADGNSGVNVRARNIGMPATVVLASTFDRDLVREVGLVIGEEARELGVDLILAPALNLHRNPLNGRHPEYFSEDPVLAGVLAGMYAQGLESTGVGACYKHLAANNAESARKRNQSIVSERALRELYLRAFEIAIQTHPAMSVMTAYNAVNGVAAAADPELLRVILREEFGFDGFVMTDWTSYETVDVVEMVRAGNNWITPGGQDDIRTRPIVEAVTSGRLPEALLRENVAQLVRVVAQITGNRSKNEGALP